jgi:competence ComEA-like helix-hairpin-helix protein
MNRMRKSTALPNGAPRTPVKVTGTALRPANSLPIALRRPGNSLPIALRRPGNSLPIALWRPGNSLPALALALFMLLSAVAGAQAADERPALSGIVNLNTASIEQLQLLPGVGEVRASAIVDARKKGGGFKSVDDLMEVRGVGPTLLDQLRPFVAVTGKTTIKAL